MHLSFEEPERIERDRANDVRAKVEETSNPIPKIVDLLYHPIADRCLPFEDAAGSEMFQVCPITHDTYLNRGVKQWTAPFSRRFSRDSSGVFTGERATIPVATPA